MTVDRDELDRLGDIRLTGDQCLVVFRSDRHGAVTPGYLQLAVILRVNHVWCTGALYEPLDSSILVVVVQVGGRNGEAEDQPCSYVVFSPRGGDSHLGPDAELHSDVQTARARLQFLPGRDMPVGSPELPARQCQSGSQLPEVGGRLARALHALVATWRL